VSPLPASSGKTRRHRLNRGGDRQANRALRTIALSRMAHDARTRTYVQRRTTEGLSKKDHPLPQALHRPRALQGFDPAENPSDPRKRSSLSRLTNIGAFHRRQGLTSGR
jgi:hypothetical protein